MSRTVQQPGFRAQQILERAFALNQAGRTAEARALAEQVLQRNPKDANALYLIGIQHHQAGALRDAERYFERSYKADRRNPAALSGLGIVKLDRGDFRQAARIFRDVSKQLPNDGPALNNLGLALLRCGRAGEAREALERAVAVQPDYATARLNLGQALSALGVMTEARRQYEAGLALAPGMPELHGNYANVLREFGDMDAAERHYREALRLQPGETDAALNLASMLIDLGRLDEAEPILRDAHAREPENLAAAIDLAELLDSRGPDGKAEARTLFEVACRQAASDRSFADAAPQVIHRLGRAADRIGEFAQAFRHLEKAHAAWREVQAAAGKSYDRRATEALVDATIAYFEAHPAPPGGGDPSRLPVFIVGMPRSGTSLLEQVLASHSRISGAGELMAMAEIAAGLAGDGPGWVHGFARLDEAGRRACANRYLAAVRPLAAGAERVVDKLPANFLNVGLIRCLFPNAAILHTRRNPLDTGLSIYLQKFSDSLAFAHDLRDIGHYYAAYARLMDFWESWDPALVGIDYEALVDDLEGQARRALSAIGLDWEDAMIDFHRTARAVRTASRLQVRQPLYRGSVEKWRRYENELAPLAEALGPLAPEQRPRPG